MIITVKSSSNDWSFLITEALSITRNFLKDAVSFQNQDILTVKGQAALKLSDYSQFYAVAIGKAAPLMMSDFLAIFPRTIAKALCIYPENTTRDRLEAILSPLALQKTDFFSSSHPLTTERSFTAGTTLLEFLKRVDPDDLVFFLISGGASALVEVPAVGTKIFRESIAVLYRAGLTIHQLNTLRSVLSMIKGGQILRYLKGNVCSFILSDVPGDNLTSIGSGLTVPRMITREELSSISDAIDPSFRRELPAGFHEYIGSYRPLEVTLTDRTVKNLLIGCNHDLLTRLESVLQGRGFNTLIVTSSLQGNVQDVVSVIYSIIEEINRFNKPIKAPSCLLFGGETTVTVKRGGKGGRNQELCLHLGLKLRELPDDSQSVTVICFGTDGIDGNSDYAGAIITRETIPANEEQQVKKSLKEHNSTEYLLKKNGCLIKTGPTGTNVMDIIVVIITPAEKSES